jgi:hypothetical protein
MNNTGGACDKLAATRKHKILITATQEVCENIKKRDITEVTYKKKIPLKHNTVGNPIEPISCKTAIVMCLITHYQCR